MIPKSTGEAAPDVVPLRDHMEALVSALEIRLDERIRDLKATHDQQFAAQAEAVKTAMIAAEKAITSAMAASEKAVLKAESASDARFLAVNEFRQSLNDIVTRLIPRAECEARFKGLDEKVDSLAGRMDRSDGRGAGLSQGWVLLIGLIGAVAATIAIINFATKAPATALWPAVEQPRSPR